MGEQSVCMLKWHMHRVRAGVCKIYVVAVRKETACSLPGQRWLLHALVRAPAAIPPAQPPVQPRAPCF